MPTSETVSRRRFLHSTAILAGAAGLTSCTDDLDETPSADTNDNGRQGSTPDPLPVPSEIGEAPMLTQLVDADRLPPAQERIPTAPFVVPHRWLSPGHYGGRLRLVTPATDDLQITQYMLGHSPLRWLNEGLDIVAGLAESFSANNDATEWRLHFRRGLKWSDGHPWTTQDIIFWWEDLVLNEDYPEPVPNEARSSAGTVAAITAIDDMTIVLEFDAPSPLFPEMLCTYAKRANDATWMLPKHYMKQFHPAYNPDIPDDWIERFEQQASWIQNTEVPTMTGWRLTSYTEGRVSEWERNPYYWVVDSEGNQLPYIDSLTFQANSDLETRKLQIQTGEFDFVTGREVGLTLADVSALREAESRSNMQLTMWGSGSGSGSVFFFNQDYEEEKIRSLIREPKFRQALSLAYNRREVQRAVYYDTGELTTGTHGPQTREFHRGDGQQMYEQWRDSWSDYDPSRAKALLDELGVTDHDGRGRRQMPDGESLVIRLEYPADIDSNGEHMMKNGFLKKDWEAVGLETQLTPVPPTALGDQWEQGRLMSTTAWDVATVTLAADMRWFIPMEPARWAPLQGQYYSLLGTSQADTEEDLDPYDRTPPRMRPEPNGPIDRLWTLADRVRSETDQVKRDALLWDMIKIHIQDGPFYMGVVAGYPRVVLVKSDLHNVPRQSQLALGGLVDPWQYPTPGSYDPESWYWDDPDNHQQ